MSYATPQEAFWAGDFGNEYIARNGEESIPHRTRMIARMLHRTAEIGSVIEYGANIGLNLRAMHQLIPDAEYWAVEINALAYAELQRHSWIRARQESILGYQPQRTFDLVFVQGVLIHINPAELDTVYSLLHQSCARYLCINEYYNSTPVEVTYRGHSEKLYKRDFAGELMLAHPDLELVDYGFMYHRDRAYLGDDFTWFLLEKR